MKRLVAVLLLTAVVLSLCGCGKTPDDFTKETYQLGKKALKVMDDYLAERIDASKAEGKLSEIHDALEEDGKRIVPDPDSENYGNELLQAMSNSMVAFEVSSFAMGMLGIKNSYGNLYDCEEVRDSLASLLE